MNGVELSINAALSVLESFWNWADSVTLIGQITFLDLTFGSYVVSLSLWFVFGFMGGDE